MVPLTSAGVNGVGLRANLVESSGPSGRAEESLNHGVRRRRAGNGALVASFAELSAPGLEGQLPVVAIVSEEVAVL